MWREYYTHTLDSCFYLFLLSGGRWSLIGGVYPVALLRTYAALRLGPGLRVTPAVELQTELLFAK